MIWAFPCHIHEKLVTDVAVWWRALSWRVITRSSIYEHICQILGIKILRRKCTYTCWSTVQPFGTMYLQLHRYNHIHHYHLFFHLRSLVSEFLQPQWIFLLQSSPWDFNLGSKLCTQISSIVIIRYKNVVPSFSLRVKCFWHSSIQLCFYARNSVCSTHHITVFLFIRYSVKVCGIIVFSIPDTPSISHTIIRLSSSSNMDTITIKVLSIAVDERQVCIFFHRSSPFLKSFEPSGHYATVHGITVHVSHKVAVFIGTVLPL